jgi:magnesium-transporting ATPase (P-type)
MAMLLWVGGIVGFIAQMAQLRIAIWTVNISKGIFSFWHEFKAEKATEALRKLLPSCARTLRDDERERVLTEELVPGAVVLLEEGDRISADARLVDQNELRVDESALTGQSHPVRKTSEAILKEDVNRTQLPNVTYAGTTVAAGTGRERVFATGMATEFGTIAHLTQTVGEELSPLQKEMKRVTKTISLLAISIGAFLFILGVLLAGTDPAQSFSFAMGIIVAFVSEGMLPTVTLSLAMGVQRMGDQHALIRRLSAVETLGCTAVICTDKAGTLAPEQRSRPSCPSSHNTWCTSQA